MAKEMRKNTLWNRIFHSKEVNANVELKEKLSKLIETAPRFLAEIGEVTYTDGDPDSGRVTGLTSLLDVLDFHKKIWKTGFQSKGICPDKFGYFRTETIENMRPEEVYLGDIYGLWTFSIPEWEKHKDEGKCGGAYSIYEYLTVYQIVLRQYKGQLRFTLQKRAEEAKEKLAELELLGY